MKFTCGQEFAAEFFGTTVLILFGVGSAEKSDFLPAPSQFF
jgi:glycerol uptake facilitator-like aquaporin